MRFWGLFLLLGCAASHATTTANSPFATSDAATDAGDAGRDARKDAYEDDPGGDADYRELYGKTFDRAPSTAAATLQGFLERHPRHTKVVPVSLLLARLRFAAGDSEGCLALLDRYRPTEEGSDRLFVRGLCESRLGRAKQAIALLEPFLKAGLPRLDGQADPDGLLHLHLALADSYASVGDKNASLDQIALWLQLPGQTEKERGYARERADALANAFSNEEALQALSVPRAPLVRAVLGDKATLALRARKDEPSARRLEQDTLNQRAQLGFRVALSWAGPGDLTRLGLAVPLTGPQSRLGEVLLRGASMVLYNENHGGAAPPYKLMVRDSAAPPDRSDQGGGASGAVTSLIRDEAALGIVTGFDARSIEIGARDKVPLLVLDERVPGAQSTAFQIIHSIEARASALANRAFGMGARRFAILGPDSPAGKRLATAFSRAVQGLGGTVTGQIQYPQGATSFVAHIENLRKASFEALFVPDDASRLELIAPALATADVWPRQAKTFTASARDAGNAGHGRREVFLLSTAVGLSPKLLQNAERYVQGALLCPGFYPSEDNRAASFVGRYRDGLGTAPSAADAYAYDAMMVLRLAIERGARNRADVLRLLSTTTFEGVTGDIRFNAEHARVDAPIVYVVNGSTITPLR